MPEFATFDAAGRSEPWRAVIRPVASTDVGRVAALYGNRESVDSPTARRIVSGWVTDDDRLTLVAEHLGHVQGFASASRLTAFTPDGADVSGWYLHGLMVEPQSRRRGLARQLTDARLRHLRGKADAVWYFVNASNSPSIALHQKHGFVEHSRVSTLAGVEFDGGEGVLFRLHIGAQRT